MAPETTSQNKGQKSRPPIVVVMGHVDHGKTTLLDYIRKTNVAAREAGGITQSVGAYEIEHSGKKITFIDTPGHEAFTNMRSRGANIADLAILVVAAEEGPKPQTLESIKILENTKTPFVVAITKTDKAGADIDKIKNELAAAGVLLEGYGGSVSYQPISAKTGEHVNELLDLVLLAAEVEILTYDPSSPAQGFILEASMNRQRGIEATLIIKNGTLKFGDEIATPSASGKVKILENFLGKPEKRLEPSAPAVVIGFQTLPEVGELFSTDRASLEPKAKQPESQKAQTALAQIPGKEQASLNLIIKSADAGSLEALTAIAANLSVGKPVKIVAQSVGDVVDNDVKLAISTGSVIAAFTTKVDKGAKNLAEANRVPILTADVIYHLIKAIEDYAAGQTQVAAGALEVLMVFNQQKLDKQVVGGKVAEGTFKVRMPFEIERGGAVVGRGRVTNLQRGKEDTASVPAGEECGMLVSSDVPIEKGDMLIIRT